MIKKVRLFSIKIFNHADFDLEHLPTPSKSKSSDLTRLISDGTPCRNHCFDLVDLPFTSSTSLMIIPSETNLGIMKTSNMEPWVLLHENMVGDKTSGGRDAWPRSQCPRGPLGTVQRLVETSFFLRCHFSQE